MPLTIKATISPESKHDYDITSLVFNDKKLYSASDDGKIKMWDTNLKKLAEVQAHESSVFSIAVGDGMLYSCSNDGTVKCWSLDNLTQRATVFEEIGEFWKLCYNGGKLYVGNDAGAVKIFEKCKLVGVLEISHPITELLAINNCVYTARDMYVIISEIFPGGKRITTLKSLEGKAPLFELNGKLYFPSRSGKDIIVHKNVKEADFCEIASKDLAHEMIINALCGETEDDVDYLYSGGWDKTLKKWKIENNSLVLVDSCSVEMVINALVVGISGEVYVGGGDGNIVLVKV